MLALVLLAGCSTVCPDQTKIEVGVTETDAKNDKLQEKKLLIKIIIHFQLLLALKYKAEILKLI